MTACCEPEAVWAGHSARVIHRKGRCRLGSLQRLALLGKSVVPRGGEAYNVPQKGPDKIPIKCAAEEISFQRHLAFLTETFARLRTRL